VELTESVAVPEPPGIEALEMLALRPEDGNTARVTVLENPLMGATVIVEVPATLSLSGPMVDGFALIVKSGVVDACTLNVPNIVVGCTEHL
jgi:hypothetical protein